MSDNFNTLLENCIPKEYIELKKREYTRKNIDKKIEQKKDNLLREAQKERIKYIKYWYTTPTSHSISHLTALIKTLTQLPPLHRDRIIDVLYSNIMIFINDNAWYQTHFNHLNDNSSYNEFVNWKEKGCMNNINVSCFNFEEIGTLYSQSKYSLSVESTRRINDALSLLDKEFPCLSDKLTLLDISKNTYNKYFSSGISGMISRQMLLSISRATGYSPDYLLDLSDQPYLYLTNALPVPPLSNYNYSYDEESKKRISIKLNELYSQKREKYKEIEEKYNFSDKLLKEIRDQKTDEIPSTLIDELGKIYNIHPFYLTNQIKKYAPYDITSSTRKKTAVSSVMTRKKYITHYLNASDAFNLLDNAQDFSQTALLRDSLFLLFVYFDWNTQNTILDNFACVSNIFYKFFHGFHGTDGT